MSITIRRDLPGATVSLPQSLPVDLPEELALTVPAGVVEGVGSVVSDASAAAASVQEALRSIEIPRDLPDRIAARLMALPRAIRLPALDREAAFSVLEDLLHLRERELRALRVQSTRNLAVGFTVGTVAGAAAVFALLPDRAARLAEIRERLGGLDAPTEYVEDVRRIAVRAREAVEERVRIAREEAQQVREAKERELWARYEVAKRDGHVPPAP